ncbi:hypothetical protein C427_0204 [Paraglaciecola psychrophila 170]|uniref:Uncharacterized protein n=1 Tax=Paraglaciecola psychrophila 170 TaxID=1129794 RepID=K7ARH3_9ALTE|nr:hypothetical protein C427_0204 [Paraglaciecola psychrophila 170]GAC37845.1 hypothetical protein GPSY_2224 [Paraglaciecola psychrophila 170]
MDLAKLSAICRWLACTKKITGTNNIMTTERMVKYYNISNLIIILS